MADKNEIPDELIDALLSNYEKPADRLGNHFLLKLTHTTNTCYSLRRP